MRRRLHRSLRTFSSRVETALERAWNELELRWNAAGTDGSRDHAIAGTSANDDQLNAPPTAPVLSYAQGYNCGQLIAGMMRSTGNVTPQPKLRYEVVSDGAPIGSAVDQGSESGVLAWLHGVLAPGLHPITVKAEDAAGNWSAASSGDVVTGYAC